MKTHHLPPQRTVPDCLVERPQWLTWRAIPRQQRDGTTKITKPPFTPGTTAPASVVDPTTWRTYELAVADVEAGCANGVGFVFTAEDPYFGIDLDEVRDPESGILEPWAAAIIARFGTYAEVSPFGTGVHLIGRGTVPADGNRTGQIEVYDRARFFTMTGDVLRGYDTIRNVQTELATWHRETFTVPAPGAIVSAPVPSDVPMGVEEVLDRLRSERGGLASRLLAGDWSDYHSPSEGRWALAHKSLFYTDDPGMVATILMRSGIFKPGDGDAERERRAAHDSRKAAATYTGQRYDPDRFRSIDTSFSSRDRAGVPADAWAVLANRGLTSGHRLTMFALVADLSERVARGEQPESAGYRTPAVRYAEMTGQREPTVAKHFRELHDLGVLSKRRRRTTTERTHTLEVVDGSTGETWTERERVRGTRDANFVVLPDGGLPALVARLAAYPDPPIQAGSGHSRTDTRQTQEGGGTVAGGADDASPVAESSGAYEIPHLPVITSGASEIPENPVSHASEIPEGIVSGVWERPERMNGDGVRLVADATVLPLPEVVREGARR